MPETLEKPELLEQPIRGCSVCGGTVFQVLKRNRNRRTETLECEHSSQFFLLTRQHLAGCSRWHRQAERLQLEIAATVSSSLKRLLNADLEQILTTRKNEVL